MFSANLYYVLSSSILFCTVVWGVFFKTFFYSYKKMLVLEKSYSSKKILKIYFQSEINKMVKV
ncbi:hypothetical protein B6A10_05900 [Flavobacterium sp. L1I52]|uniref:ATP synthase F0 subunit 8 n=1 Tax=Flavobacterium pokkalii TaxID=1940408 RepID=A0ABR7UPD7_9FLAO|nr:hypothetical protein [Flavobacterium pokkalii]